MKTMVMYGTIDNVVREVITLEFQLLNNKHLNLVVPSLEIPQFLKEWSYKLVEVKDDTIKYEQPDKDSITYYEYKEFIISQALIGNVSIKKITENFKDLINKKTL